MEGEWQRAGKEWQWVGAGTKEGQQQVGRKLIRFARTAKFQIAKFQCTVCGCNVGDY